MVVLGEVDDEHEVHNTWRRWTMYVLEKYEIETFLLNINLLDNCIITTVYEKSSQLWHVIKFVSLQQKIGPKNQIKNN
jgi:hypothetical protein